MTPHSPRNSRCLYPAVANTRLYSGAGGRDIVLSCKVMWLRIGTIIDSVHRATSRLAPLLIPVTTSSVTAALTLRDWLALGEHSSAAEPTAGSRPPPHTEHRKGRRGSRGR